MMFKQSLIVVLTNHYLVIVNSSSMGELHTNLKGGPEVKGILYCTHTIYSLLFELNSKRLNKCFMPYY